MSVQVLLPGFLADLAGGARQVDVDGAATVGGVFDRLAAGHPLLERRIRDETGALRRFVNVYVDGEDIRFLEGLDTPVDDGDEVTILPAVAGG